MAKILDLPRFGADIERAISHCFENGIAVISSEKDPCSIQEDFLNPEIGNNSRSVISLEIAGLIIPEVTEIILLTKERILWQNYAKIFNNPLNWDGSIHQDYGGQVKGITILTPLFHGSKFTTYSDNQKKIKNSGEYWPGDLMLMRQRVGRSKATTHSYTTKVKPTDLEISPLHRVLMTIDSQKTI